MKISRLCLTLATVSFLASSLALGKNQAKEEAKTNFITLYSGGINMLLASPVDAGLRNALNMIDFSQMQMPGMGNSQDPQAIYEMLMSKMSLSINIDNEMFRAAMSGEQIQSPPYSAQLNVYGKNADQNKYFAERVGGMLAQTGQWAAPTPSANHPGMMFLKQRDPDSPNTNFGETMIGDKSAFVLAMNSMSQTPVSLDGYGLPDGIKPALAFRMDMGALKPIMQGYKDALSNAAANPQTSMAMGLLNQMGLMSDTPPVISFAMGQAQDRTYVAGSYMNCGEMLEQFGTTSGLAMEDMKLIPQTATYANISKMNLANYVKFYINMMNDLAGQSSGQDSPKPVEMLNNLLGVNIETQFADYLGQTLGIYQSPETGGQSLMAMVVFVELSNSDGMKKTIDKFIAAFKKNKPSGMRAIELLQWNYQGNDLITLSFSGMPIPLELSMGMGDNHIFMGASPQSVIAAMQQASGNKVSLLNKSILDNTAFMSMGGDRYAGAMQVQFFDTAAFIDNGYSLTNMMFAAISNVSRRPGASNRSANLVMPTYDKLVENLRGSVSITRRQGNSIYYEAEMDRSFLANTTALVGSLKQFIDLGAITGVFSGVFSLSSY